METAVGVFAQRDAAEEALKKLLEGRVPEESIVYLTRSESEAKSMGKQIGLFAGSFVGGAAGLSAGVAAAMLLSVPGIGQVFALGIGAAAFLGLVGARSGAAIGSGVGHQESAPTPTSGTGSEEDVAFFDKVLNEGHSLIVVRTDSPQVAASACAILDSLAISMRKDSGKKSSVSARVLDHAVALDFSGKITLNEGTYQLREAVQNLLQEGSNRILLNLQDVQQIDSAGLGELVRAHTTIRRHGGILKIVALSKGVQDLFRITKLDRVFEMEADEDSALRSVRQDSASAKSAD
ncbi:MAG TPA: STAS domain-containing protein [Candidatus Acidoferrum sp.]|nr:STAS domain-containing protein [Candidatus Acidoferrum sp.]